jgi:hypothetical protein
MAKKHLFDAWHTMVPIPTGKKHWFAAWHTMTHCHLLPLFHTGPTCRISREGAPDWTRICYSKHNVVGYVIQNEVASHGHTITAPWSTTVICDVVESKL